MIDINSLLKATGNEYAGLVKDGVATDTDAPPVDTGSYSLNALLSGSIYGGLSPNKITAFAGKQGVGKTYFALSSAKGMQQDPNSLVYINDTEAALTQEMFETRGLDTDRLVIAPVTTVEEWRTQTSKLLSAYEEQVKKDDKARLMIILDSLGNLSTEKEVTDIESGASTRDMTRAAAIKGAFRALTIKLAKLQVPLVFTNHTYDTMALYSAQQMSGGSGPLYNASTIVFLSKAKEKEATDQVGNVITMTLHKGRQTKEGSKAKTRLFFDTGLDRYYGLVDIALKHNVLNKTGNMIDWEGTKVFEKTVYKEPEKYFSKEMLDRIDEACKKEFLYGSSLGN